MYYTKPKTSHSSFKIYDSDGLVNCLEKKSPNKLKLKSSHQSIDDNISNLKGPSIMKLIKMRIELW